MSRIGHASAHNGTGHPAAASPETEHNGTAYPAAPSTPAEHNGTAYPAAPSTPAEPNASTPPAPPTAPSPPSHRPPRGRQIALATVLAIACVAAAVLSVRAFVLASTNRFAGVIQPAQSVSLNFAEIGHLSVLNVSPGDHVKAGQVLARLDPLGAHAAALAASAAQAATAADQEALTAEHQNATAPAAVKQARVGRTMAQLVADRAQLAQIRVALGEAAIRSPVNGMVTNVSGAVGDLVGPVGVQGASGGSQPPQPAQTQAPSVSLFSQTPQRSATASRDTAAPLIQLAAGPMQAEAQLPESAVKQLRPGRGATVTVPALGTRSSARLLRVLPDPVQIDGNVSYGVLFSLRRTSAQVLPGMSADVTLDR